MAKLTIYDDNESGNHSKVNKSVFMLTINTNRMPSDDLRVDLERNTSILLNNIERFIKTNDGFEPDDEMVINVYKGKQEVGINRGRVHCHCVVEIFHDSNISVDGSALALAGRLMGGYKILNKHVFGNDGIKRAIDYSRKNL